MGDDEQTPTAEELEKEGDGEVRELTEAERRGKQRNHHHDEVEYMIEETR